MSKAQEVDSRPMRSRHQLPFSLWLALWALLGAAVGGGVLAVQAQEVVSPAQELFQRGFDLQKAGQTGPALQAYEQALQADPDHVPTLYEIGWSYWVLGRWADVVRVWERVLVLQPDHEDARKHLPEARQNLQVTTELARASAGVALGPDDVPRQDGVALRLALGGDTMLGGDHTLAGLPAHDGAHLLDAWRELMSAADLAFLNYEGVFIDDGVSDKCPDDPAAACWAFGTPTRYARNLTAAGLDVVSIANNHGNDYGAAGRASTRATLDSIGLPAAGIVGAPPVLQSGGQRVGFLAFATSPGFPDLRRIDDAVSQVKALAAQSDLVVVSFHGGAEGSAAQHVPHGSETYRGTERGDLRAFTHAVIDAGADLVIGHGPHVWRGLELYRERLIAYSMGNFTTYGGFNLKGPTALTGLLLVDLAPDGRFAGGRLVSGRQAVPGIPALDPSNETARTVAELSRLDFGEAAPLIAEDGTLSLRKSP